MHISGTKIARFSLAVFVFIELVCFLLIQIGVNGYTDYVRFSSIVIAFLFALLFLDKNADSLLCVFALLFTVCADYCLVIMEPEPRMAAMVFFNTVQLCYFVRIFLNEKSKTKRTVHVCVRLALIVVAVFATVIVLGESADALSIVSIIYFSNLLINIIFAFCERRRFLLFAIGLLSFAFCDVFVGLGVLVNDYIGAQAGSILYSLTHTEMDIIWFFYVPSQTLIAISNYKDGKTENKKISETEAQQTV